MLGRRRGGADCGSQTLIHNVDFTICGWVEGITHARGKPAVRDVAKNLFW